MNLQRPQLQNKIDIQKRYSRFQEGLARVRDGSSGEIGMGYWILNIFGVSRRGNTFTPLSKKVSLLYCFTSRRIRKNLLNFDRH